MQHPTAPQARPTPAWRSPWVIGWLALLVSFISVNLVMIYLAFTTNPGLVVPDYSDRGQYSEHHLASKLARDAQWSMRIELPQQIKAGEPTTVRFHVEDKADESVVPDAVTFYAYRPSDVHRDFSFPMVREAPGRYAVLVEFPLIGVWDVLVAAQSGKDEHTQGQRISVLEP